MTGAEATRRWAEPGPRLIPADPGEWMDSAACAQTDPELFFPIKGGSPAAAKMVCAGCDVSAECLAYALGSPLTITGIWGGTTERERRDLMRGVKRLKPIKHGTEGGARSHVRRGEPPCRSCREAATAANRRRRGAS